MKQLITFINDRLKELDTDSPKDQWKRIGYIEVLNFIERENQPPDNPAIPSCPNFSPTCREND
jgi:hypothetical protein